MSAAESAAERLARRADDLRIDGARGADRVLDAPELEELRAPGWVERETGRGWRLEFEDGSAVVGVGAAWDVRHGLCTCGWCWAGAGMPLCGDAIVATAEASE